MTSRRFTALTLAAVALSVFALPASAGAQTIWDTIRDRAQHRRDRDDDYGRGRRGGRLSDHERRVLRDTARRINDRSRSFERNLDRALDRSRIDDTPREDNINQRAREFRSAADRFRGEAGDSNDLYRSQDEARQLLQAAARVERSLRRIRLDSRASSDWSQIRTDLRTVADIYNLRVGDFDDDYGRGRRGNSRW